jgi:polyhydroxyalkanoate synthase
MNLGFLWLKPFSLIIDKYVGLLDHIDDPVVVRNFLRMEHWIFDSPDQAGEAFRKFIKDLYQENRLVKGTFSLGGRQVDLKKITMPVLNIFGEHDHLVPPECSRPLSKLIGSKDVTTKSFPVGHIGMYVSGRSQSEIAPTVANWLTERYPDKAAGPVKTRKKAARKKAKKAPARTKKPSTKNSRKKA